MTLQLLSFSLHHIDIQGARCTYVPAPAGTTDLEQYLMDLMDEVRQSTQNRIFTVSSPTTEFSTALAAFHAQSDLSTNASAGSLAKRMLNTEVAAEQQYGHLGRAGEGHLKKGSFLQCMYSENGNLIYLGVKVEHHIYLDEADHRRHIGLGDSQKVYKACVVLFDSSGVPDCITVFDTNSSPSAYWWRNMLELMPKRDDEENTRRAVDAVLKTLNSIKRKSPADYTLLRNASIAAFKQSGTMKFDDFVTNTFVSHTPLEPSLVRDIPALVVKLRALPVKSGFDSQFSLAPNAVRYSGRTVKLNPHTTLKYEEDIPNLSDKIWESETPSGKKVIVIEAPDAVGKFEFKEWT